MVFLNKSQQEETQPALLNVKAKPVVAAVDEDISIQTRFVSISF